jgi:[FeFe] hydrogenase (group B1/B3)
MINGRSVIDDSKCKKCQMCVNACPYKAIVKISVPCEDSCPVGAIKKDETGFASIDYDKCINCGRCTAACPFGAVHERSQIIDILKAIKSDKKVIAMIAPSIIGQFPGNIYQLKTAIINSGFDDVYEVAQGADITANTEAKEFTGRMEEGQNFMTTSCCAGYNQLIKKHLPEIKPFVSDTKTPLYYTAEIVKKEHPDAITVFVSPCVAKRAEGFENPNVDFVMNYEELGALFIAKKIQILDMEESKYIVESSKQGRNFGYSGGVAESVKKSLKDEDSIKPCIINGLNKDSIKQLKKYATSGVCEGCNLVEVMCCEGGCIGGNATINNQKTAKKLIDNFTQNSEDISKI